MISIYRTRVFFLSIWIVFLFLACGSVECRAQTGAISGEDDFGRKIVLESPPERIVLISGSPLDAICEMGAGDLLVGVVDSIATSYPVTCRRYPFLLEKERVGRFSNPSIEKIISLDPDLVFAFGASDSPGKYTEVFERRGIPYAVFVSVKNTEFGLEQIMRMGTLLGRKKQARALADSIRKRVENISGKIASETNDRPLVYYWWGKRNGTYGRNSSVDELIELAGGINLAGDLGSHYFELSPEYVIARDPDVVVISYWKENEKKQRLRALENRAGFSDIKAVKNNRVYAMNGHAFHTPVRFAEVIRNLARFFHPELFEDGILLDQEMLEGKHNGR